MKKILKLFLSSFCVFSLIGCSGSASDNSSNNASENNNLKYNVTFYLNDGTDDIYKVVETTVNTVVERPTNPTRSGYVFKGWYVDQDCLVNFSLNTLIKADTSLYAKWIVGDTSSSDSTSEDKITYTIDSLPTWIKDDDCVIFAWVWSTSNPGEWIPTTYISDTSLVFEVENEITGMLLVRCKSGTTTPDWSINTDIEGRIYNKTDDIEVSSGVTNYSCSKWNSYPY